MRPDGWKLEPSDSADAWRNIERTSVANDTPCRGVVLLGLSAPEAELVASFQVAAAQPLVKGFAVGRPIFGDAAARRFGGDIDDEAAVDDLAAPFGLLLAAWRRAQRAQRARPTPRDRAVRNTRT